ncbi:MAG: class I SAM-dependent methyltransferase [Solirubrobacteraceae bacterium]
MAVWLNLGSGTLPLEGFTNVDALPDAPGVDLVADISQPLPFADGSVNLIYAVHLLEHFATDDVPALLADWRRVLAPGGKVLIAVPDLDTIARMLIDREGWFTPPHSPWVGAIYGGQKDEYDFHKTGFTEPWLAWLLDQAGFGDIRRVDRFAEVGANDASHSPLPFGKNVSLNMTGTVGGAPLPQADLAGRRIERAFDALDRPLSYALTVSTSLRARAMGRRRRRLEQHLRRA